MVIREAGLLFRGFTLINQNYHKTSDNKIDKDLRSGLLTAIITFAENAFSQDLIEYFELKRFVIAFTEDNITAEDCTTPELLIAYAIFDKEKKIDKHIRKVVVPLLTKVIIQFKEKFSGKNLSEISQFKPFSQNIDKIFGKSTKTLDQKMKGTFF